MTHRIINGLHFAASCAKPKSIPAAKRLRGSRAAGKAYENKLAKALPFGLHNPWYEFRDNSGHGYCSPDVVLQVRADTGGDAILILECKLSNVEEAESQLRNLYAPVVSVAHGGATIIGIIVTKHLKPGVDLRRVCTSLDDAMAKAQFGIVPILHWLGNGPLRAKGLS